MNDIIDYIVVGSGCSGAMAAQTLVESGASVLMLDAGYKQDKRYKIPNKNFLTLRKTDKEQHRYFIGDNGSGIRWGDVGKGEQITPPRDYIDEGTSKYLPIKSSTFEPFQSLAYGGLGAGWGLQCWKYSAYDLERIGLSESLMNEAYEIVSRRIGVSGKKDEAAAYTLNGLKNYQPSPRLDINHRHITKVYRKHKKFLMKHGVILGRTPLALLTKDMGKRKGFQYKGMEFYDDSDLSAWRPWITINALRKKGNFTYVDSILVTSYKEVGDYIEIQTISLPDQKSQVFRCRKLMLAAGSLNSGRIILRSHKDYRTKLPLLCNPYRYIPCIQPKFLGKKAEKNKLAFTQLSLFLDRNKRNEDVSVSSIYSYQSLMLFRIVRNLPFNFLDSRILSQYLVSGLILAGVHHPDEQSKSKYIKLIKSPDTPTGDELFAKHTLSTEETKKVKKRDKSFIRALRNLGIYGLKAVDPGNGASIHYAGTLPFSEIPRKYRLQKNGKLHGSKGVYVVDSSGFNYLPAKGLTFSLMANAHRIAKGSLDDD